jgi:putative redox protein
MKAASNGLKAALHRRVREWAQDRAWNSFRAGGAQPGTKSHGVGPDRHGRLFGYDVVHILEKGREAIEDVAVELEAERAEQEPKVFTRIHMHFVVKGRGLAPEKVGRAIVLSVEKYCSASAMIAKTATITHDFEVVDTTARPR